MKKLILAALFFSLGSFASLSVLVESLEPDFNYRLQATLTASSPGALNGTVVSQQESTTCEGTYKIGLFQGEIMLEIDFTEPNINACKLLNFSAKYSLDMHDRIKAGETIETTILVASEFRPQEHKVSVRKISEANE